MQLKVVDTGAGVILVIDAIPMDSRSRTDSMDASFLPLDCALKELVEKILKVERSEGIAVLPSFAARSFVSDR